MSRIKSFSYILDLYSFIAIGLIKYSRRIIDIVLVDRKF